MQSEKYCELSMGVACSYLEASSGITVVYLNAHYEKRNLLERELARVSKRQQALLICKYDLPLPHLKENRETYRVLADEMSSQESPVGTSHNEHICVIYLTAFQNLLHRILSICKQKTG